MNQMVKKVVYVCVVFFLAVSPVFAGQITGVITHQDGSPCSTCYVSASISWGGVTDRVSCDSKGQFTLTWSSDNSIAELYVNGSTNRKNVKNGEYVVIVVK